MAHLTLQDVSSSGFVHELIDLHGIRYTNGLASSGTTRGSTANLQAYHTNQIAIGNPATIVKR
jgi:hypothetical protein